MALAKPLQEPAVRPFRCLTHVIVPTMLGGIIYLLFRQDSLLMFRWVDALGAGPILDVMRSHLKTVDTSDFQWFFYSLPDALWVYSFTTYMVFIWGMRLSMQSGLWLALPLCMAAGSEIGQGLGVVAGTYDAMDLALCFVGAALPLVLLIRRRRVHLRTMT